MSKKAATASPAIYRKEELLTCAQTVDSSRRVLLCGRCCRPAGDARHHLALALGKSRTELRSGATLPDLPDLLNPRDSPDAFPTDNAASTCSTPFWCQHKGGPSRRTCDEAYCSSSCRDAAAPAHSLVCCQGLSTGAPLLEFDKLTSVAGLEHFRTASRLLAAETAAALNAGPSLAAVSASAQESAARLEALCASDVAGLATLTTSAVVNDTLDVQGGSNNIEEEGGDNEKLASAARTEEADALEAGGLLHVGILAQLDPNIGASPLGTHLVAPQLFARLTVLLRRRQVPLHVPSPLQAYCTQLAQAHARDESAAASIDSSNTPSNIDPENHLKDLSVQERGLQLLLPAAARAVDLNKVDDGNEGDLQSQLNALLCAEARDAALEAVNGASSMNNSLDPAAEAAQCRVGVDCDTKVVRRGHLLAQCAPWLFPPADLQALAPGLFHNGGGSGVVLHSCVPTAQLQLTPDDLKISDPSECMRSSSKNHEDGAPPLLVASLVAVRVDAAAALHAADSTTITEAKENDKSSQLPSIPVSTLSWADFDPHSTVRERQQALRRKFGCDANVQCKCERCMHEGKKTASPSSSNNLFNSVNSNGSNNSFETIKHERQLMVLARDAIEGGRFDDAVALLRTRLKKAKNLDGYEGSSGDTARGHRNVAEVSAVACGDGVTTTEEEGTPWVLLGLSLLNLGLWSDARRVWARGVTLHPTHPLLMLQRQKDIAYNQDDGRVQGVEGGNHSELVPSTSGSATPCETYFLGKGLGAPKCVVTSQPLLSQESCIFAVDTAEAFAAGTSVAKSSASIKSNSDSPSSSGGGKGWTTSRHYSVPTTDLPVHGVPQLVPWFADLMTNSVAPLLEKHFSNQKDSSTEYDNGDGKGKNSTGGFSNSPFVAEQVRVHDAFVVRYSAAPGQACHLPLHCDESTLSFTLSLNTARGDDENANDNIVGNSIEASNRTESLVSRSLPQYSGGGTYFAALRRAVRPKMGCCALFDGRALHGGEPTTAGTRYILAAFLYIDTGIPRHLKQKRACPLGLLRGIHEDVIERDDEEHEPWEELQHRQDVQHIKRPRLFEPEDTKQGGFSFGFSFD